VIDYQREDFTKNGERYDVVFDAVGMLSFRRSSRSLSKGGTLVDTDLGFMFHLVPLLLLTRWAGDKKVKMGITKYAKEDVQLLARLLESGEFRAVIDRRYPLEEVVEATRYVETGQKVGNVVLLVTDPPPASA
jgi:NADPH:quinone reductase-like Zn-dependent oxidoreductase